MIQELDIRLMLEDIFMFLCRFIGGSDPCYDDILGKFGCSEGMEADSDDCFRFLILFMLVFWEDLGSS